MTIDQTGLFEPEDCTLPGQYHTSLLDMVLTIRPYGEIKVFTRALPGALLLRPHWRISDYSPVTDSIQVNSTDYRFSAWLTWDDARKVFMRYDPDYTR